MPPVNHALASAGVAAVTLAVAAAIAIYESDDIRRVADDIRRRIAVAFQSIGNEFNHASQAREPIFNRPEDAEGFLLSRSSQAAAVGAGDPGVDADEATRKRQREELMYWNAIRESKIMADEKAARDAAIAAATEYGKSVGSGEASRNFDDFLRQDEGAAAGTFVFNTGAEVASREGVTRRKGATSAVYANPFADENEIDMEDIHDAAAIRSVSATDMYQVTPRIPSSPALETASPGRISPTPPLIEMDADEAFSQASASYATATTPRSASPVPPVGAPPSQSSCTMSGTAAVEDRVNDDGHMTAGQDANAYASIQAWAQGSQPDFYSPLPMSPEAPASEAELLSAGQLTPTDSVSVVDVADHMEQASDAEGRDFDVLSQSEGIPTPASWSEVGSVVSDSEPHVLA